MAFPVSPTEGQTFTENNTVWIYSAVMGQWNRSVINPLNETLYKFGSASATGSAGEIQYTDGTNLAASPNLVWDDVNDELEVGGDVVLDDGGTYTTTLQTITPTANRTVSLPDATGTVALVAGSSGQLVYNNAGAQAGASGSVVGATGDITLSLNGAASVPPFAVTGTWFAGTTPQVLIQPSNVGTVGAWSASGTGIGVNAVTGFGGNLLDLQVNGSSRAALSTAGRLSVVPSGDGIGFSVGTSSVTLISATRNSGGGIFDVHDSFGNVISRLEGRTSQPNFVAYRLGVNTQSPSVALDVDGNTFRLRTARTPASATATGAAGEICWDASYIYVCTATNTWKRAAISTW